MIGRLRLPFSFRARNRNLPQEAGSTPGRSTVMILAMESGTAAAPLRFDSRPYIPSRLLLLLLLVVQWIVSRVYVEAAVVATPRVTLIVFADKPMAGDEWAALSAALGKSFESLALETHFALGGLEIVRGDTLAQGAQFDAIIPIFLHGSCRLLGQPAQHQVLGPLGWVLRDHSQILPAIHVDCGRISEMLGPRALWMNQRTRNGAMAEAISRVVVHEWVHIATQSAAHTRDGIEKPSFALEDLIPDFAQMIPHSGGK